MKLNEQPKKSRSNTKRRHDDHAITKLRLLVSDLQKEVELLDQPSAAEAAASLMQNGESILFFEEVKRFEIALIKNALKQSGGHQGRAARSLNLSLSTLNHKIKQYGITPFANRYGLRIAPNAAKTGKKS